VHAVEVDAIDAPAVRFYEHFGFRALVDDSTSFCPSAQSANNGDLTSRAELAGGTRAEGRHARAGLLRSRSNWGRRDYIALKVSYTSTEPPAARIGQPFTILEAAARLSAFRTE
jgi:hypothetical protein